MGHTTPPTVGSYWAANFIHHLGRVVKVLSVDGDTALCEIVRDEDDTVTRLQCGVGLATGKLGKVIPIKVDTFRPFDRPIHRGLLPATGPDDYRTSILTHEDVHPIKHRGLQAGPLLKVKYENGWTITATETGDVVDFEPRCKGDAQPWRSSTVLRFRAGQCSADFPGGMGAWFGTTTETNATKFPTDQWFQRAHLLVSKATKVAACGVSVWWTVRAEVALGLRDDLSVRAVMCEKCEAEAPGTIMEARVQTRLGEWTGKPSRLPTGSFDLSELDEL